MRQWFLRIPATAHDFNVICARNVRDLPQAKLDSQINARFLLNKNLNVTFLYKIVYKSLSFHGIRRKNFNVG